jgi:hypothetical protein
MFRVGVSAVVAGVMLATLCSCGDSSQSDRNDRPRDWATLTATHKANHATNHLILGKCYPADTPNHITVCAESNSLNVKECRSHHPRHGFFCVKPRPPASASTGHPADGHGAEFWTKHRMQSATPN